MDFLSDLLRLADLHKKHKNHWIIEDFKNKGKSLIILEDKNENNEYILAFAIDSSRDFINFLNLKTESKIDTILLGRFNKNNVKHNFLVFLELKSKRELETTQIKDFCNLLLKKYGENFEKLLDNFNTISIIASLKLPKINKVSAYRNKKCIRGEDIILFNGRRIKKFHLKVNSIENLNFDYLIDNFNLILEVFKPINKKIKTLIKEGRC